MPPSSVSRLVAFPGGSAVSAEPAIGLLAELIDKEARVHRFFLRAETTGSEEWLQEVSEGHMGFISPDQ